MRSEQNKQAEIVKLLSYIYFEWGKEITPELIGFWRRNLEGLHIKTTWVAAKELVSSKSFGEPKFQDFMAAYNRVERAIRQQVEARYNPWATPQSEITNDMQPIRELIKIPEMKRLAQ